MAEDESRSWKDQYMLRFPDGLRDRIKDAAKLNNRSMNQEIIAVLEAKYPPVGSYDQLMRDLLDKSMRGQGEITSRLRKATSDEQREKIAKELAEFQESIRTELAQIEARR